MDQGKNMTMNWHDECDRVSDTKCRCSAVQDSQFPGDSIETSTVGGLDDLQRATFDCKRHRVIH